jgi:predicted aminopeptidase
VNRRGWLADLILCFVITLVVASVVTLFWNLIFHKTAAVDWDTAFILAFTVSIATTVTTRWKTK